MRQHAFVLVLGSLFTVGTSLAGSASAQNASPVRHTELAARLKVAGIASSVNLRQAGQRSRMDVTLDGVSQSYIADREKGVLISMIGKTRVAFVFPLDRKEGVAPLPMDLSVFTAAGAKLQTIGASLVNGRACRLIQFSGYLNQAGSICVNPGNIVLSMTAAGRREPLFEVVDLNVANQDASWFRPPAGYQLAVMPSIGGASGPEVESGNLPQDPAPVAEPLPRVIYGEKNH